MLSSQPRVRQCCRDVSIQVGFQQNNNTSTTYYLTQETQEQTNGSVVPSYSASTLPCSPGSRHQGRSNPRGNLSLTISYPVPQPGLSYHCHSQIRASESPRCIPTSAASTPCPLRCAGSACPRSTSRYPAAPRRPGPEAKSACRQWAEPAGQGGPLEATALPVPAAPPQPCPADVGYGR